MKTKKLLTQCSILSILAFCAAPPAIAMTSNDDSILDTSSPHSISTSTSIPSTSRPSVISLVGQLDKHIESLVASRDLNPTSWHSFNLSLEDIEPENIGPNNVCFLNKRFSENVGKLEDITYPMQRLMEYFQEHEETLFQPKKYNCTIHKEFASQYSHLGKYADTIGRMPSTLVPDTGDYFKDFFPKLAPLLHLLDRRFMFILSPGADVSQSHRLLSKTLMRLPQPDFVPGREVINKYDYNAQIRLSGMKTFTLLHQLNLLTYAMLLKDSGDADEAVRPALDVLSSYIASTEDPGHSSQSSSAASSAKEVIAQIRAVLDKDIFAFTIYSQSN